MGRNPPNGTDELAMFCEGGFVVHLPIVGGGGVDVYEYLPTCVPAIWKILDHF